MKNLSELIGSTKNLAAGMGGFTTLQVIPESASPTMDTILKLLVAVATLGFQIWHLLKKKKSTTNE